MKEAATVEAAKTQVNDVMNKIVDELKKLGVEEKNIKTVNYSVNPNYDYANGRQTLRGYQVNADVQAKLKPVEQANKALDVATQNGATNVGGVQFTLDDQKRKELENEARKEAIKIAKEKAKSLAEAAGIKLGKIIDVQEAAGGYARPAQMALKSEGMGGDTANAPTELNPGENKVSITVTLSYETH